MGIRHYYYAQQLKKASIVFANIFAGLRVRTGMNGCGLVDEIEVPIRYGSTDRVASAIGASDTQNRLHTLPMMSVYLRNIELAPDRQHGISSVDRRSFLEQGGVYPDDVKVLQRVMPVPYNLSYELSIYASNTDQAFQLLEQILILFDYQLQVQFNDAPFDWSKITRVNLESISNEENYPVGPDRRILVWTFTFTFETWFSLPMEIRNEIISRINIQIGDIDNFHMEEYDENGELIPFEGSFDQPTGVGSPPGPPPVVTVPPSTGGSGLDSALPVPVPPARDLYDASLDPDCHVQPPHN